VTFQERVLSDPTTFALSGLVWVVVALWVVSMISWMIQGDVDGGFGIVACFVAIVLGVMTTSPPAKGLTPYFFSAVVGTMITYPIVRRYLNRREMNQMDLDQVERAYEVLRERPDNLSALLRIARVLYERGLAEHAVALGQTALKNVPRDRFHDEYRELNKWKMATRDPALFGSVACLHCRASNAPGTVFCSRCRSPLMLDYVRGGWNSAGAGRKLIAVWILLMFALVGVPLATRLPAVGTVATIVVLVGLGAWIAWFAFREKA